jgi:hypothetical protein
LCDLAGIPDVASAIELYTQLLLGIDFHIAGARIEDRDLIAHEFAAVVVPGTFERNARFIGRPGKGDRAGAKERARDVLRCEVEGDGARAARRDLQFGRA